MIHGLSNQYPSLAHPWPPFSQDHFFQPAIDAGVEKALSDKQPVTYGAGSVSEVSQDKAIGGQPDFSQLSFTANGSQLTYGNFINAAISFLIIAAVVFVFVVKPMNVLLERTKTEEPEDPAFTKFAYCFTVISSEATRCPACTSEIRTVQATSQV